MWPAELPIVDAHHHFARLEHGYPWLAPDAPTDRYHGDDRSLRHDYLRDDYLCDVGELPVIASVHIENGAADPIAEARWIDALVGRHAPLPAAQIARAALGSPGEAARLEELASIRSVRGVRHILNWHADPRFTHTPRPGIIAEAPWVADFARLAGLGLSFELQVFASQLAEAERLLRQHPETTVVLDHAGMPPDRDADTLAAWRGAMARIAAMENVDVKVSALGTTDHSWTVESLSAVVLPTIDLFGPERVIFASNFPVDGMYSTMPRLYRAFADVTAGFRRDERLAMFAGNAVRVYRLDPGLL